MTHRTHRPSALSLVLAALAIFAGTPSLVRAQMPGQQGIMFNVQGPTQRLEMIVNTSRILTLEQQIPTAQVANKDVLDLTPLSATQIQVFAKKTGVTQINLWNDRNEIRTVDVVVFGDSRELEMVLKSQFPRASLTVTPLANSVIIGGYVDRPDQVNRIIRISEDYHPNIINNISVGGVQQVLLNVTVMEISRTKARALGIDLTYLSPQGFINTGVSGLINVAGSAVELSPTTTLGVGVVNGNKNFFAAIEALAQNNVGKILAHPKLVTVSGRPARFQVGGEFPVPIPAAVGSPPSITWKNFGTEVDFVPIVLGNGRIRLEVRPIVSERNPSLGTTIEGTTVPGLTKREVDTGVEMAAGQTLAIAGLVQTRTETETRGLPWIRDVPYVGAAFRRNTMREEEIETLIMVTPHLIEAMDPHEVPPCGPGTMTEAPSDWELFMKGYTEVPKCCPPGGEAMGPGVGPHYHPGGSVQGLPPGAVLHEGSAPISVEEVHPSARPNVSPLPRTEPNPQSAPPSPPEPQAAVRRASPSQGVPARPTSTTVRSRSDRHNPPEPRARSQSSGNNPAPGFIGPTGYDVQ